MSISSKPFGVTADGQAVSLYTLTNRAGAHVSIATLGGAMVSLYVPDRAGALGDVLLGYDRIEAMQAAAGYMGKLVGRFANRIAGGRFTLNGQVYQLAQNNGENALHGGTHGFDSKVWDATVRGDALILRITSPDGEEQYPGTLQVQVTYTWNDDNALGIAYEAVCDRDTILNLTNHAYFNLSGPACTDVCAHEIRINADAITAVSSRACIPTGELMDVTGTPFDLRAFRVIADGLAAGAASGDVQMAYGNGYDHNFVLQQPNTGVREAAVVRDAASGRRMTVLTDQPGVQFYGGNSIGGTVPGKLGVPYVKRQGLCLETQTYPDGIHHANFPSCVLRKGDVFRSQTIYRFDTI